ncbi:MAG: hypothetical protein AABX11_04775 [Nanoarchaeota archaeon]
MAEKFPALFKLASKGEIIPETNKEFDGAFRAKDLFEIQKIQNNISTMRGQIVTSSLNVESRLDDIIVNYFFSKHQKKKKYFIELFLEKEFLTFMQKWKILKDLLDFDALKLTEVRRKVLLKKLHEIIETRNSFAHGEIVFFRQKAYLEYLKSGKKNRVRLSKGYENKISVLFNQVIRLLDYLKYGSNFHSSIT